MTDEEKRVKPLVPTVRHTKAQTVKGTPVKGTNQERSGSP